MFKNMTIKYKKGEYGYVQSMAMKKVWQERHSGKRPMIRPGKKGKSETYTTPFCHGFRIETQDRSLKGKHYPFLGKYCGEKKRYSIKIWTL